MALKRPWNLVARDGESAVIFAVRMRRGSAEPQQRSRYGAYHRTSRATATINARLHHTKER